jgi:hypothetical protein
LKGIESISVNTVPSETKKAKPVETFITELVVVGTSFPARMAGIVVIVPLYEPLIHQLLYGRGTLPVSFFFPFISMDRDGRTIFIIDVRLTLQEVRGHEMVANLKILKTYHVYAIHCSQLIY